MQPRAAEQRFEVAGAALCARKGPIARSQDADELAAEAGVPKLPESLFLYSGLELRTRAFALSFNAAGAVRGWAPGALAARRRPPGEDAVAWWAHTAFAFDEPVQVPVAGLWKEKRQRVPAETAAHDWTFLSDFAGTFEPFAAGWAVQAWPGVPQERLTPANPVLWFCDVYLFESDLDDWGYACLRVRARAQADCVFVLLRSYTRVDEAEIRAVETRVFVDLADCSIIRRVDWLRGSYAELREKGFSFDGGFNLDPEQADRVAPLLTRAASVCERFAPPETG